jgi:hypothetical protein
MLHGHGVDNCSLRFCKKGRQLDLGENRSLTQIFQGKLLHTSHSQWVYVCAFGERGDGEDGDGDDGNVDDGDGDGDDGDGNDSDGDDGDDDGIGDGNHRPRST